MTDLVIGARRSGSKKTARNVSFALVLLVALAVAGMFAFRRLVRYAEPDGDAPGGSIAASTGGETPRLGFADSSLAFAGDLAVLRLRGDPLAIGTARGRLLAGAIADGARPLLAPLRDAVPRDGLVADLIHGPRARWRYRRIDDGVPGHQLVEIYGLARGAAAARGPSPSYEELVRTHASMDLGVPAVDAADASFQRVARSLSLVTSLQGPAGDRLVLGRSFGLPGAADGGDAAAAHRTVALVHPEGAIAYASVEWPGLAGAVSGINAEGIAVMVHPARTADVSADRTGQPIALLARDILENARSLDDAIGVLREASPLGAAAFLVADGRERAWAVVERSPGEVAVTRSPEPPVVTGVLRAEIFADDPENDRAARTWPEPVRARRAAALLAEREPAAPDDVAAILRDRRGEDGGALPRGHRAAVADPSAVHVAMVDCTSLVLYVAEGPGGSGPMRAFDLRHELRGEGARPAPPADIARDPDTDLAASRAVRAARAKLREARRAWAAGRRDEAWTLVQRALARVPDLPEALLVAGHYARARGDADRADALYRRYLRVGGDDRGELAEIRALVGENAP